MTSAETEWDLGLPILSGYSVSRGQVALSPLQMSAKICRNLESMTPLPPIPRQAMVLYQVREGGRTLERKELEKKIYLMLSVGRSLVIHM